MLLPIKPMRPRARRELQCGAAALAVTMLLLFSSSIVVFYLNRGLIFEQKVSANQLRSTTAFEMAEAGVEWATGMLNNPLDVTATCTTPNAASALVSFRTKYVWNGATPNITPSALGATASPAANRSFPGCKVNGAVFTCDCPAAGSTASLGSTLLPGFTVTFAAVSKDGTALATPANTFPNSDDEAVLVTATGCTAQAGACVAGTALDATASVSVILKLKPLLRAAPAAALSCGTSCEVGGSFNIANFDAATNGITVDAGTTTLGAIGSVATIPGLPPTNSIIGNDTSLSALASSTPGSCTDDKMFNAYFGSSMAAYAAARSTKTISCTSASDCGTKVDAAYNQNWRAFYFPLGLELNNSAPFGSLGSSTDGVTIVSPAEIKLNGNINVYGLIFSNDAHNGNLGTGTSNVYGAMVTCEEFTSNGNGLVQYDAGALTSTRRQAASFVRVPGSWRDFQ